MEPPQSVLYIIIIYRWFYHDKYIYKYKYYMLCVVYPSYIYASVTRPCFYCSPPPRASRAPQLLMIKSGFRLLLFILLAVHDVVVILHRRRAPDRRAMDGMALPVPPIDRLLIYFFLSFLSARSCA